MRTLGAAAIAVALLLLAAPAAAAGPGDWPAIFTSWPKNTPNQGWPDGPFLGNGNIGLSVGGSDGEMTIYLTVHGFWSSGSGSNSTYPPLGRPSQHGRAAEAKKASPGLGFPGCPADNCTLTVGLTIGGITLSSSELAGGSWTGVQYLTNASATVTLKGKSGAAVVVTAWVTATDQLAVVTVAGAPGSAPLTAPLNLTVWSNRNVRNVPVVAGCVDGTTGQPAPCPPAGGGSAVLPSAYVRKDANSGPALLPLEGVLATRVLPLPYGDGSLPAALSTAPHSALAPAHDWVTNKIVNTTTLGITSMVAPASLAPGRGFALAAAACASRDPSVAGRDPGDAASAWLAAVDLATGLADRWQAHAAWWDNFWSASLISLDSAEADTEAFWYTAVYALGSGSRAGQLVMDLWSPWRTTDLPLWRSNPTTDYNAQAVVSAVTAVNHPELAGQYFDFYTQQLARGGPQLESSALGCPGGAHASVDLAPWGLKMGVWGEAQDWGILSNAAYISVNYLYTFYSTPLNATWVRTVAWPWLNATAAFWKCTLVKTPVPGAPDGYQYFDPCDCNGDEGCSVPCGDGTRSNPMWAMVYVRRLLQGLTDMASSMGLPVDPAWGELLAHLPPLPTTRDATGAPVLAWYGSGYTSWGGQSNNLHALWPSEVVGLSEANATLLDAALNSFNQTAWAQDNSFNWVFPAATRAGVPPSTTLSHWHGSLAAHARPNRLLAWGGACSDTLGAAQFPVDMLVQWNLLPADLPPPLPPAPVNTTDGAPPAGAPSLLRLFPAWPSNLTASFERLRMRGALLVSAVYEPAAAAARLLGPGATVADAMATGALGAHLPAGGTGGVLYAVVTSEAGAPVSLLSPWPGAPQSDIVVCHLKLSASGTQSAAVPIGDGFGMACPAGSTPLTVVWSTLPGRHGGQVLSWPTVPGGGYTVVNTGASARAAAA